MDFLRDWILGVTAAAILGTAASAIAPQGGPQRIVKLCTALVLAFAILRPLTVLRVEIPDTSLPSAEFTAESLQSVGRDLTARIIEERSGAYIVSKAQALGLAVEAKVLCTEEGTPPEPYSVTVHCDRPEHAKNALKTIIQEDLNIPPERQNYYESYDG